MPLVIHQDGASGMGVLERYLGSYILGVGEREQYPNLDSCRKIKMKSQEKSGFNTCTFGFNDPLM